MECLLFLLDIVLGIEIVEKVEQKNRNFLKNKKFQRLTDFHVTPTKLVTLARECLDHSGLSV